MINFIRVFDANFQPKKIIDTFSSIIWRTVYYDSGDFELYAPATMSNVSALTVGNFIVRSDARITAPARNLSVGMIESVHRSFSLSSGEMLTVAGRLAKNIPRQRIVYKGLQYDSELVPTIISGNVEDAARDLFAENLISSAIANRNVSFLALGTDHAYADTLTEAKSISNVNLFDALISLLKPFGMSYDVGIGKSGDDFKLFFEVKKGADRTLGNTAGNTPVIFSEAYDNITDTSYSFDVSAYKTDAIVGGSTSGRKSTYYTYTDNAAGLARRETNLSADVATKYQTKEEIEELYPNGSWEPDGTYYIDGEPVADSDAGSAPYILRTDFYIPLVHADGQARIEELAPTENYNATLYVSEDFQTRFGLGDLVTLQDRRFGVQKNVRVSEIIETQDDNGYVARVTVSDASEE